ncbi:helix-turn-helix domain-containing protein [Enterococcus wangshanyuanii]|uniref:Transcriptional regulator n=1 Tax=Enterococcus wangshanyuanii TaxID=2005703 RepID=A0ABQ1PAQ1_9ENTE|nr:helix-turn-helix transcriptional regulator [Enterococcus wangshanyuanii]GGC92766.1 transcriptional regulator [Enterococcus wangshanyuanii]
MFSERLLKMRKNAELTQEELAKKINVSKQSVGSWERGRTEPSIETITELANVLNTTTDYLLGRTNQPIQNNIDSTNIGNNITSHFRLNTSDMNIDDIEELEEELTDYMEFLIKKAKEKKAKREKNS